MRADPLTPALEDEAAFGALLHRWELGIADEELMDVIAPIHESVREIGHPRGEAPDERIAVGSLERDEHDVIHARARIMARAP